VELIHDKNELISLLKQRRSENNIVGYVPTMGALHQGHLSLVSIAQQQSDIVVISIFVNPTQFDNADDLEKYPKTLAEDLQKLKENFDNLIIFAPNNEEVYENNLTSEKFDFGELAQQMEGASREGHFDGVGTILKKFFTLIQPDKAFFGEKDFQQLLIVKKLVEILNLPIEIIGCPIHREENGLARSSRNKRLTADQQKEASFIYEMLSKAKTKIKTNSISSIIKEIKQDFKSNENFNLDYFEIVDAENLKSVEKIEENKKYRAFIAAYLGEVRLIDNIALN